ncbi:MAG: hypothetical protein ACRDHF_09885 [Tepidiformaceae bacterium]
MRSQSLTRDALMVAEDIPPSLGAVMGSEALVALQDIMGLDSDEAVDVCRWMARTLTGATLGTNLGQQGTLRPS